MSFRPPRIILLWCAVLVVTGLAAGGPRLAKATDGPRAQLEAPPGGALPVVFEPNRGQADPAATYLVRGKRLGLLFGSEGVSYRLSRPATTSHGCPKAKDRGFCPDALGAATPPDPYSRMMAGTRQGDADRGTVDAVHQRFEGARGGLKAVADAPTGGIVSIFSGPPSNWKRGLETYGRLVYHDVWPGIDVVYEGQVDEVKQSFIVRPGADPAAARLVWQGARSIGIDDAGTMIVDTPAGPLKDAAPVAWQIIGGRKVAVDVAYRLDEPTGTSGRYGFRLGAYDPGIELVIDPAVVVYAAFYGTKDDDRGLGIVVDNAGAAYITGHDPSNAFVVKLSPNGTKMVYKAIIAGAHGFDVDVDSHGSAFVTGAVSEREDVFPVYRGPDLTFNGGQVDAFVAKLSPAGNDLEYAGYIGGAGADFAEGIVVDEDGNAYLTGLAESTEATFPVVVGPDLTQNGQWDAWVAKLKPEPFSSNRLNNFLWSGFIGGAGNDVHVYPNSWSSGHINIDIEGNAYISGETTSREDSFPDGDGFGDLPSFDRSFNGLWDAYVAKVRADGKGLVYAGYIGGDSVDEGKGMVIDAKGAAYLTGNTFSDERTFPVRVGPDLTFGGQQDAFVAKIRPDGTALEFCGYVGGDGNDSGQAVDLGPDGALYLAGWTESTEATLEVTNGPDLTHNGPTYGTDTGLHDALVGRLKADVSAADPRQNWDFLGYLGGSSYDLAFWLSVDKWGDAYVVGDTWSDGETFPDGDGVGNLPSQGEAKSDGDSDAFVAKVAWKPITKKMAFLPFAGQAKDLGQLPQSTPFRPTPMDTARPNPTRTATPTPGPTRGPTKPVEPPLGETLLFADDFSDPNSGWTEVDQDGAVTRYVDGALEVGNGEPDGFNYAVAPGVVYGSGAVEVTVARNDDSEVMTGIALGPASGSLYFWMLWDGRYLLVSREAHHIRALAPAAISPHLSDGTKPNRIRIERYGSTIVIYSNGHHLLTAVDPALGEPGIVGLMVQSSAEVGSSARFDDLVVTRWPADRPKPADPPTPTEPAPIGPTQAGPTPTPRPTSPGAGPRVLLSDDFSNARSGWPVQETTTSRGRYVNGEYEIALLAPNRFAASPAPRVQCADCTIETTVRFGGTMLGFAGLILGESGADRLVMVELYNDGRYAVDLQEGATWTSLIAPTSSPLVHPTGANRLRAVRKKGHLTLTLNGSPLVDLDEPGLKSAGISGLMAVNFAEAGFAGRFDDFVVRENDAFAAQLTALERVMRIVGP